MSKSSSQKRPAAEALQQVEEEELDNNNKKQRMMNYDDDFDFDSICFDNEDLYLQGLDLFEVLSSFDLDSESTQQQQPFTEIASQPPAGYIDQIKCSTRTNHLKHLILILVLNNLSPMSSTVTIPL
ncbi:hypothetical protein ACJIZ3_014713 [Penstemon smallii]|uniref:Uncharacterized protein n=1 Tax=Penstemon smallii TaxID=265156 RepID=A0ABD3RKJ8_9LAMI